VALPHQALARVAPRWRKWIKLAFEAKLTPDSARQSLDVDGPRFDTCTGCVWQQKPDGKSQFDTNSEKKKRKKNIKILN
jgi:hypothetical protein